jgi:hypothetical protein
MVRLLLSIQESFLLSIQVSCLLIIRYFYESMASIIFFRLFVFAYLNL